jgi:hypothetical protein
MSNAKQTECDTLASCETLISMIETLPGAFFFIDNTDTIVAHWRLSWEQRLAHNARPSDASPLFVTLYGLPATFAHSFGFALLATA